jgi:hypothetical protein
MGEWNGRGVEVSLECDARQQVAAVAEPLSSVAAGDLLRTKGRYGASAGFCEYFLEREEAVLQVSAVDAGDERPYRFGGDLAQGLLMLFDCVDIQFDGAVLWWGFTFI